MILQDFSAKESYNSDAVPWNPRLAIAIYNTTKRMHIRNDVVKHKASQEMHPFWNQVLLVWVECGCLYLLYAKPTAL